MNEVLNTTETLKRGPGRPSKEDSIEMKKGRESWQPASILDIFDKEPGFRYRVVESSGRNIAKKQREGWEMVSNLAGPQTGNNAIGNGIDIGKSLTSVHEGHDYVIMRMPEELGKLRDDYINRENDRRTMALKRMTQDDIKKTGAPLHGSITMEKRGIKTIIKD